MIQVAVLLGGFFGQDGWVTSSGMLQLISKIRQIGPIDVQAYSWTSYEQAGSAMSATPGNRHVVVAYSGGGSRFTWLANSPFRPIIDLAILYDPSPRWQMVRVGPNVKRAVCFHNTAPMFFGYGGGILEGTNVETINIAENHMLVQFDWKLHKYTIEEIKKLAGEGR